MNPASADLCRLWRPRSLRSRQPGNETFAADVSERFAVPSGDAAEPPGRQARGDDHQRGADDCEQGGDLGFLLLDDEARAESLIDLLQVLRGAGVEVVGVG